MEEKIIIGGLITIASLAGAAAINTIRGIIKSNKETNDLMGETTRIINENNETLQKITDDIHRLNAMSDKQIIDMRAKQVSI